MFILQQKLFQVKSSTSEVKPKKKSKKKRDFGDRISILMKPDKKGLYSWSVARYDDDYDMWINHHMGLAETPEQAFQDAIQIRKEKEVD